jgi:hypothetical protein
MYPFRYTNTDAHIHDTALLDELPHPVGIVRDSLNENHVERYHSLFDAEMLQRLLLERKQLHKPGATHVLEINDPLTGKAVPLSGIDAIEWPNCDRAKYNETVAALQKMRQGQTNVFAPNSRSGGSTVLLDTDPRPNSWALTNKEGAAKFWPTLAANVRKSLHIPPQQQGPRYHNPLPPQNVSETSPYMTQDELNPNAHHPLGSILNPWDMGSKTSPQQQQPQQQQQQQRQQQQQAAASYPPNHAQPQPAAASYSYHAPPQPRVVQTNSVQSRQEPSSTTSWVQPHQPQQLGAPTGYINTQPHPPQPPGFVGWMKDGSLYYPEPGAIHPPRDTNPSSSSFNPSQPYAGQLGLPPHPLQQYPGVVIASHPRGAPNAHIIWPGNANPAATPPYIPLSYTRPRLAGEAIEV